MKTFEERYPEHNNPEWQIRTWAQEEDLERAKSEHEDFIQLSRTTKFFLVIGGKIFAFSSFDIDFNAFDKISFVLIVIKFSY